MLNNGPDSDLGVSYKMPIYETVQQDSARTCCDCWRQSSWTQHLGQTDGRTDGRTDRRTDRLRIRVVFKLFDCV